MEAERERNVLNLFSLSQEREGSWRATEEAVRSRDRQETGEKEGRWEDRFSTFLSPSASIDQSLHFDLTSLVTALMCVLMDDGEGWGGVGRYNGDHRGGANAAQVRWIGMKMADQRCSHSAQGFAWEQRMTRVKIGRRADRRTQVAAPWADQETDQRQQWLWRPFISRGLIPKSKQTETGTQRESDTNLDQPETWLAPKE